MLHIMYMPIHERASIKRYSGGGEPSGTAGMPVLDVIVKMKFLMSWLWLRYFGGSTPWYGRSCACIISHGSKIAVEAAKPVIMQNCLVCEAECAYNQPVRYHL